MKKEYDFVFLSNTPSFYKINLCEAIAKNGYKLLLVLYGYGSEAVNKQLSDRDSIPFDFYFINNGNTNCRNRLVTFIRLWQHMRSIKAKKVLYSGWLTPEYNLFAFISPRKRNIIINESPIWLISVKGIYGLIKLSIIQRMSRALPSGTPHLDFFKKIGFKGKTEITGSVGIISKKSHLLKPTTEKRDLKYLCVARLIDCKNLSFLIEQFNMNGLPLTIVGQGELEAELKAMAKPNISFAGFIDNDRLGEIYQSHDVFILPSTYEAWGLVVEEALYWGLPVIVSNRVGSGPDMVSNLHTGVIFDVERPESFTEAICKLSSNYAQYREAVLAIDWDERERRQVQAYINLLK